MPARVIGGDMARAVVHLTTHALDCVLEGEDPRPAVCQGVASLVGSTASAHARYDATTATSSLCLWRREREGVASIVRLDQLEPLEGHPAEQPGWWMRSQARLLTLHWLGCSHLAELPLAADPATPSLLVVGRGEAFDDLDAAALALVLPHLATLDRALHALAERTARESEREPAAPVVPSARAPLDATGSSADAGRDTLAGAPAEPLTHREREVLLMLSEGLLARSIAQRLSVSERTVHKHLGNLYRKLDAHDRLLAVRRAEVLGLVPAPRRAEPPTPRLGGDDEDAATPGWS